MKNVVGILMGIALNMYITFGNKSHFYSINSASPGGWKVSLSFGIFFCFFTCLKVFIASLSLGTLFLGKLLCMGRFS